LAKSGYHRIAAPVLAGLVPAAALLLGLWMEGAVAVAWVVLVLATGAIIGCAWAVAVARSWTGHAERLDAIAAALESRRPPPHLLARSRDAMGQAERRLLEATDAIVSETDLLAEQRDELEAVLRGMSEAVVVTGARGEVVLLNGAARTMFALSETADYRGRDFVELCRDPHLQEFVARSTRSASGAVVSAEISIQAPGVRHLKASAAPIRDSHAGGATWVLVFYDLTQLKTYQTVRSDFVANLTHELRTPLSALYGYAETLLKGVDDVQTQRRFLTIIERQARRLARLLDDLISLSDLERGLTPLKIEPIEPGRVLEDAAELMREQAARNGVRLEVKCSHDLPLLAADRDRLHQVLLNLLDNAIKYTPREGQVTLGAHAMLGANGAEPRPGVAMLVADTGEGISAADIPRLTERFYRVDRARSRELGGTGLGLAIVKHIVQLHHGSLKIESKLREGTTVTVWIPSPSQGQ
jgi:two-component system, OmpR family, phosphate regulon sensor histidine kinase PhoR